MKKNTEKNNTKNVAQALVNMGFNEYMNKEKAKNEEKIEVEVKQAIEELTAPKNTIIEKQVLNNKKMLELITKIKVNDTLTYSINTEKLFKYQLNEIDKLMGKINQECLFSGEKKVKLNCETLLRLNEIILFSFNKKSLKFSENTMLNLMFENTLKNVKRTVVNKQKCNLILKKQSFEKLVCKVDKIECYDNLKAYYKAITTNSLELSNSTYTSITERNKTYSSTVSIEVNEKTDIECLKKTLETLVNNNVLKNAMIA